MKDANIDDKMIGRQEAIILSMTKAERKNPKLMNGSRRARIAAGSGTSVPEVNKLMKAHQQMEGMMKQMKKLGKKGFMRGALGKMLPGM
jgi:signal recognition particle subunit SRP54